MGALANSFANALLDASVGTAALTAVPGVKTRLMTANGSASAAGTELATGGGYTSGTGAPSTTFTAATGAANANAAFSITNMPAATIAGIEEWDTSATPRRIWWGALTASKTTSAGDTLSFPAGSITLAFP